MFLSNHILDFYRIEIYRNSDDTLDAFLFLRISAESPYRAKNYGGGDNDRWDLIAAKLDLLSDGLSCRELVKRISAIPTQRLHMIHVGDQLGFTLISECPALDDVHYNDYVESRKVMDIYFNDGATSKIRSVLDIEQINNSDIVARFAFF